MEDGLEGLRVEAGRLMRKKQIMQKAIRAYTEAIPVGVKSKGHN